MGHRQLPFPFQSSNIGGEDVWNHPYPDPHLRLGTTSIGVNHMPYFDSALRSNNFPSSNLCLEIPNGPYHSGRVNPGNLHDFFPHPPSASSSNLMPPNYIQGGLPCYDGFAVNSRLDYERAQPPYKRKNPAMPMGFDGGNSYHCAGSSSSFSVSSVNLQAANASGPQYVAWDPNGMPSSYRGNNSLPAGEGSQRNVRSRQSLALHLGNNGTAAHQPSNLPLHLHPMSNISGLTAAGQWSETPASWGHNRRMVAPPGAGSFSHEMNHSLASSNSTNSSMDVDWGYYHGAHQNRITSAPLPIPHPASSQIVSAGRNSYDQRMIAFRDTSTYQHAAFSAPLAEGRWPGIEVAPPPRYSRPLSIIGRSNDRNGRSRVLYDRLQPFSYGNHAHNGWVSEERAVYDSRNFFDQHRDLRLDIDSMTYEELLALEERIGNVDTGLSGDAVSRCMSETVYTSRYQHDNQEEKNCAVCLEGYKGGESVGRLACGHDFHSSCIKKWLSIKNACPICKAPALPDGSKGR